VSSSIEPPSPPQRWIVITSINQPTPALQVVSRLCTAPNPHDRWAAVVVGDTKTPPDWSCPGVDFLSVDRQKQLFGPLAELLPYRHYCRKNLGYLYAIERGANLIVDTDDDNIPYPTFGHRIDRHVTGRRLSGPGWVNVYKHFADPAAPIDNTNASIWPRGLPLDAINAAGTLSPEGESADCPIQQYLADNDPDVDAIYRLTHRGSYFFDRHASPVVLDRDCWVPFNSQNTAYFSDAFPLLYLPCHVSFRMTDIWRSFVAQAALWHHGQRVSFHAPTVEQLRNEHDLMKDFADEVCGYLDNRRIGLALTQTLSQMSTAASLATTALTLWRSLEKIGVVPSKEMAIIEAWLGRLQSITR
jgi:hypothetical protein